LTRIAALLIAGLLLAACGRDAPAPPGGDSERGPGVARRVVTLAPHLAELMVAAGAGGQLVGVSAYTDYPPEVTELPLVGDAFTVDLEQLKLLDPDLVLAWGSGMPAHTIEGIESAGFRVVTLATRSLDDVARAVEEIGRLTGNEASAGREARRFRNRIAVLEARFSDRRPVRVFYQVSARPLYTINGDHFISELIEVCGGQNVFATLSELAPAVDVEAVLASDPEVIIVGSGMADLDPWRRFETLTATRAGNLLTVDADHLARASTRLDDAAERLCEVIVQGRGNLDGVD
jgi:iron complex transport system substrate-binding protein